MLQHLHLKEAKKKKKKESSPVSYTQMPLVQKQVFKIQTQKIEF